MNESNDSKEKLIADLPNYTKEDFMDNIPFERASHIGATLSDLDEYDECLKAVYDAGKKAGVDETYLDFLWHAYWEDFAIEKGIISLDPPEEILENLRLEQKIADLEAENERLKKQQIIHVTINSTPSVFSLQTNSNLSSSSSEIISDSEVSSAAEYVTTVFDTIKHQRIGGRDINLDFGDYLIDWHTGEISTFDPQKKEIIKLCRHFIIPVAYVKRSDGETINLAYYKDEEWHELKNVKRSVLYSDSKIYYFLQDNGVDVYVTGASLLAKYFKDLEPLNRKKYIPVYRAIKTLGWEGENFKRFAPYGQYEFGGVNNMKRLYNSIISQKGSMAGWIDTVKLIRDDAHILARIILAASFASVLIRPLEGMRFIINVTGKSGRGKSLALRTAASVWGSPDTYIASFDSTDNGSLQRSNFLSDLPLILDESETKKSKNDYDEFIYTMCSDYDRVTARADADQPTSKNCIFISGEHNIINRDSNLGAKSRVLDLQSDDYILFDETGNKTYADRLNANFGYAGRIFIEHLIQEGQIEYANSIYQKFLEFFPIDRQARIPALILTTDELMDRWIFKDGIKLIAEDLIPYLRRKEFAPQEQDNEALQQIIDKWLLQQLGVKQDHKSEYGRKVVGKKPFFAFYKDQTLIDILNEAGCELEPYIAWAKEHGRLATSSGKGNKRQVSQAKDDPKHDSGLYAIYLPESP